MSDTGVETELKIPVADLDEVRSRLVSLGAEMVCASMREVNHLLDTGDLVLSGRGCVLRLRSYGDFRVLTFKGQVSYDGAIKVRPEFEVQIEDLEKMRAVLEALGYVVLARYEKDRETWKTGGAEVVLDHTPMGDFVEVEGPAEVLESIALSLGLDPLAAVRGSYMSLWAEYRTSYPEKGLPHDMVFPE